MYLYIAQQGINVIGGVKMNIDRELLRGSTNLLVLSVLEKEKWYKRNIMFLFAGHFDKPLKSLISIAHKENNICLYRFSFIYVTNDL